MNASLFAAHQKVATDAAIVIQRHVRRWLRRRSPVPSLLTSLHFLRMQDKGQAGGGGDGGPVKTLAEQLREKQEAVAAAEAVVAAAERQERRRRHAAEREAKRAKRRRQAEAHLQMLDKVAQMQRSLRGGGTAAVVVRTGPHVAKAAHSARAMSLPRRYGDGRPQTSPGCANRLFTVPPSIALDRRPRPRRRSAHGRERKGGATPSNVAAETSEASASSDEDSIEPPPGAERLPRWGVGGVTILRQAQPERAVLAMQVPGTGAAQPADAARGSAQPRPSCVERGDEQTQSDQDGAFVQSMHAAGIAAYLLLVPTCADQTTTHCVWLLSVVVRAQA